MKPLTIFLSLFVSIFSYTQEPIASSKEKIDFILKTRPATQEEINEIYKEYNTSIKDLTLLINKSKEASYANGELYGCTYLGGIYKQSFDNNSALKHYTKALEIATKTNNFHFEIKSLNAIGHVYRRLDDIKNALIYHKEALERALFIKNPDADIQKSISLSENGLGNIYIALKQHKLALTQFNKSIAIQKKLDYKLGLAVNYQNIGKSNEELGNLEEALKNYNISLNYNNKINSKIGNVICNYSIASVLIKQEKFKTAIDKLELVLPLALKEKDEYYLSYTYSILGLAQTHLNKYNDAEKSLSTALKKAEKYSFKNVAVNTYENLAFLYQKKQDYKKAYNYDKRAKEEGLKIFNNRSLSYVTELISEYEQERADNKIEKIKTENIQNRNIVIAALISFLLFAVFLFSLYKNKNLKNEKKYLSLKQEALQAQMNPHFVFNALNSIKLYIINNNQKSAVYYLNKFAKLIRKILEASKIKEISLQEEIDTMDLYLSIENIRFNNEIKYTFEIDDTLNLENIKVPPLMLQPFLENAIWHGLSSKKGIKKITVSVINKSETHTFITIEDNGIGRHEAAKIKERKSIKRESLGVELTKERLSYFGRNFENSFEINYEDLIDDEALVKGTKVEIKIPIV